ncbi:hypothetical protein NW761_001440 [Fusarium oxysporum]|nr:hypothetical protein NW758_009767 [Fusarium oxysporum]KAJ4107555.1 hypothetical protein NW761_001440 [Fusarium oxysporum]
MVTAKETNNTFALLTAGGSEGYLIIFHYHNNAHDIFLCTQGQMNVWANDQGRTLNPGDMASVPPGVIHRYQILGTHTEFWGPIVPADLIEMFYAMGDIAPGDSVLYQSPDTRDPMKALFPHLKDLPGKHDFVPVPDHPAAETTFCLPTDNDVQTGQTIFIPAGNAATLETSARYASLYVTCDGVVFPTALEAIGKEYLSPVISVGFDSDPDVSSYAKAFERLGLE